MVILKKIIEEEKDRLPGVIETIDYFKTWFNKNLAIVITDCYSWYEATLVIYEPAERGMKENLLFGYITSHSELDIVKGRIRVFKERLNGNNPAIYFRYSETIVKIELPSYINPDDYIRPLDIIKIKRGGYNHVAIYLTNDKVCHIMGTGGMFSKISFGGIFGKINSGGILGIFGKINSVGVRITDWKTFLGDNPGEVTRYHAVIPFKRMEKIIEHIEKALLSEYGEGEYNLMLKNCEHFANTCVYGINVSEQVEEWLGAERLKRVNEEIKENDKMFANLKTSRQLTEDEELTIKELQRNVKVDDDDGIDDRWSLCSLWSYGKSLAQQFFSDIIVIK